MLENLTILIAHLLKHCSIEMIETKNDRSTRSQIRDVTIANVSLNQVDEELLNDNNRIEKMNDEIDELASFNVDDANLFHRDKKQSFENNHRR